jgi:photosystem II stability/assembly factor-like uncharacterized protein
MKAILSLILPLLLTTAMAATAPDRGPATQSAGSGQTGQWEPLGISGGGSMYTPAISPADPKLMLINCDMSAAYLSADGGRSWQMIHHSQLMSNTFCRPAFHPKDPRVIFAASGWSGRLKVSRDAGKTWSEIGNLPGGLRGEIAIDPGNAELMLAGVQESGMRSTDGRAWRSSDGGKTWARCEGPKGLPVGFHFDQTSPAERRVCFAATGEGVWRSDDGGKIWAEKSAGLPWRGLRSFAGGSSAADKLCALYCAIPAKNQEGKYAGGVFRSLDRGENWESAMGEGINQDVQAADQWAMGKIAEYQWVLAADGKPLTVYALNTSTGVKPPHHATVYRTDDGGKTWRSTFHPDARFEQTNVELDWRTTGSGQFMHEKPYGAAICPANPDWLMFCGSMSCYITQDGGKSWHAGHSQRAPAGEEKNALPAWFCNGLAVTTTWHYYIDPFEPQRHYIAYTDLAYARSLDGGKTWRWSWWETKPWTPWLNTCYEMAFDPRVKGKIWAAFSSVHDIPNSNIILDRHQSEGPGGICLSTDFGENWALSNVGLPDAPATSIVLDPKSPVGSRTLYAGVFDQGVFKSTDDGKSWKKASRGLGAPGNMRVCRVALHADGTLFALVTAKRKDGQFLAEGTGLYRSTDGADNWEALNTSRPLLWPKDFTVAPTDSKVIYVGAADADKQEQGGLYRTADGGKSWQLLARKGPQHFGAYLHPKRPGWIYMTLTEGTSGPGLWLSRDDGKTWSAFDALPFKNIQRVQFDPADASAIYVTTFGGSVWRGPPEPGPGSP